MSARLHTLRAESAPAAAAAGLPRSQPAVHTTLRRDPAIGGEITGIMQRVFLLAPASRVPEAVAFSAIDSGAGCSWTCARVAEALAEQACGKVCVVDANLRSPSLHEHFGVAASPGLSDALRNGQPVRAAPRPVRRDNLWFLAAGSTNAAEGLLQPARLRLVFAELRAQFDFLLVDTPPVGNYQDAVILSRLTDGIILVVGWNSTRRETARAAKLNFQAAGVRVVGAVLSKREFPIPEALYRRL